MPKFEKKSDFIIEKSGVKLIQGVRFFAPSKLIQNDIQNRSFYNPTGTLSYLY